MSDPTRQPRISVVIPCLDGEAVLGRQLEALSREAPPFDWEVIVVDNGSTDGTGALARRYADRLPGLQVLVEPQRGRHHACNTGVERARAERVAFVDADDVIGPGYVAAMAAALDRSDVVAGALVPCTAEGEPIQGGYAQGQTRQLMSGLDHLPFVTGANFGVRRSAFLAVGGFSSDIPFAEDIDLSWKLQHAGYSIAFEETAAVGYHQRATLRAMFRQQRRFGVAQALLYAKYRHRGMGRRQVREALGEWWRSVAAVPYLRDPDVRTRFVRRLGRNLGRLQGSARARVLYL